MIPNTRAPQITILKKIAKQQSNKLTKVITPLAITLTAGIYSVLSEKDSTNKITAKYNKPPAFALPNARLTNDIKTNNPFERKKIENPYQLNYLA